MQELTASTAMASDQFGFGVDISGDFAIVSAPLHAGSGAAYAFQRTGKGWVEIDELIATDAHAAQGFGSGVAIDGDYAVVGARNDGELGLDAGAAYVFHREGKKWVEVQKLTASDGDAAHGFGVHVDIDGDHVIVGTDTNVIPATAYVFRRKQDVGWIERGSLTPADSVTSDAFPSGVAVAISGDLALLGARSHCHEPGVCTGAVWAFQRQHGVWSEQQELMAVNAAPDDSFGVAVVLEGDLALVGASGSRFSGAAGAAHLFRHGGGLWVEIDELVGSGGAFGRHVDLGGSVAIVGAALDTDSDGIQSGAASLYDVTTIEIPFDIDPGASEILLTIGEQELFAHLIGTILARLTIDCDGFSSLHIVDLIFQTTEGQFEFELANGATALVTDPVFSLAEEGAPPTIVDNESGMVGAAFDLRYQGSVSGPGEGVPIFLAGVFVKCLLGLFQGGACCDLPECTLCPPVQCEGRFMGGSCADADCGFPSAAGGDAQTDLVLAFPELDFAFELDLGLGDMRPMVAVTGTVGGLAVDCPSDVNRDGVVSVDDLLDVILAWGRCPGLCGADIDHDGVVGVDDLLSVILAWGPCP
ncbi:MAG: hypothetical protein ACYTGC_14355 [Planctomycetota bacterium]